MSLKRPVTSGFTTHIKVNYPRAKPYSQKQMRCTFHFAEKSRVSSIEMKHMALHFGIKLYPRPKSIPEDWKSIICKTRLAEKYINPLNESEHVTVVPPDKIGHLPYIIHRTPEGYADARWFYEVIPELEKLLKEQHQKNRTPFSKKFNEDINDFFEKQTAGEGMTLGQVDALNYFFGKYVPGLEGICTTCYKVSLPDSGAGEKWMLKNDNRYEIRLSAAKPKGKPGQRNEYVSHTVIDSTGEPIFATWDKEACQAVFVTEMKQEATHIPYELWDFEKINIGFPGCTCKRKIF